MAKQATKLPQWEFRLAHSGRGDLKGSQAANEDGYFPHPFGIIPVKSQLEH